MNNNNTNHEPLEELSYIRNKNYSDQAIWFLNAHWHFLSEHPEDREHIWKALNICHTLDSRDEDGKELDEFQAHMLLERLGEAETVKDLREGLNKVGLEFKKTVALFDYLIYKFKAEWRDIVIAPQGSSEDDKRLDIAQNAVQRAKKAMDDSLEQKSIAFERAKESQVAANEEKQKKLFSEEADKLAKESEEAANEAEALALKQEKDAIELENDAEASKLAALEKEDESRKVEAAAVATETSAVESEKEAVAAEKVAQAAETRASSDYDATVVKAKEAADKEQELAKAEAAQEKAEKQARMELENVEKEVAAFQEKLNALESIKNDDLKGQVARGTAANELAQLLQTDPLPLQRARITEEAATRRQKRLTQAAAAARGVARKLKDELIELEKAAEQQRQKAIVDRENAKIASENSQVARANATKERAEAEKAREAMEKSREVAEREREAAMEARMKAGASARESEENARIAREKRADAEVKLAEAVASAAAAEVKKEAAEEAKKLSEVKAEESIVLLAEAERRLETIRKLIVGVGRGKVWFLERTFEENKKYMNPLQLAKLEQQVKEGGDGSLAPIAA